MRTQEDQLSLEARSVLLKAFPNSLSNNNNKTTLLTIRPPLLFLISLTNINSTPISLRLVNIRQDLSLLNLLSNLSTIGECQEVVNRWLAELLYI